jgi:transcriptional regulator with XRE-family HTH domain
MVNTTMLDERFWDGCENFGDVLKDIREDRRLSQRAFGRDICVSKSAIDRWEHGKSLERFVVQDVIELAVALQCTDYEMAKLIDAFFCHTLSSRGWSSTGWRRFLPNLIVNFQSALAFLFFKCLR